MENRRPRNYSQTRCKKHPKHEQSPGVCSVCLRERLSQISRGSRSNNAVTSSSFSSSMSLSPLSSHCSSSDQSPEHHHRIRDLAPEKRGLKGMLGKSRSLAFIPQRREGEEREEKKKGSGFWTKLLRPRSKKVEGGSRPLRQSRTMRERVFTTRVH